MRTRLLIILTLVAYLCVAAGERYVLFPADKAQHNHIPDSTVKPLLPDTASMDSLHLAIWKHNKAIDDSLALDSINKKRKNGIDAPVHYTAEDSMTYEASTGYAHLYGSSNVSTPALCTLRVAKIL